MPAVYLAPRVSEGVEPRQFVTRVQGQGQQTTLLTLLVNSLILSSQLPGLFLKHCLSAELAPPALALEAALLGERPVCCSLLGKAIIIYEN